MVQWSPNATALKRFFGGASLRVTVVNTCSNCVTASQNVFSRHFRSPRVEHRQKRLSRWQFELSRQGISRRSFSGITFGMDCKQSS
jgi:hypothetical protein